MKKTSFLTFLIILICLILCGCSAIRSKGGDSSWDDLDADQATRGMTNPLKAPEGAEKVRWQTYQSNVPTEMEVKYRQLLFTLNGTEFCAREHEGIASDANISEMDYKWTSVREDKLSNWGKNGMSCTVSSYVGDDNNGDDFDAMLVEWYDSENWIMYSLSAVDKDLDGLDIVAIADQMRGE
jgi:hypothetical protein